MKERIIKLLTVLAFSVMIFGCSVDLVLKDVNAQITVTHDWDGNWLYQDVPAWNSVLVINGNNWTEMDNSVPLTKGTYTKTANTLSLTITHYWDGVNNGNTNTWIRIIPPETATGNYSLINNNTVKLTGSEFDAFYISGTWIRQ